MSLYSIREYRGKPTLFVNNTPTPCYAYSDPFGLETPGTEEIHRKFTAHGCKWYLLCARGGFEGDWHTSPFWTDDNVFPELTGTAAEQEHLCRQAALTLKHCPATRFWVRFTYGPPKRWRTKFPDHLQLNGFGKTYMEGSLASDSYVTQCGRYTENLVRFCERQPWADRVAGYLVFPPGEGTTLLTCDGFLFDRSPVMRAAFRSYCLEKIGREADVPTDPERFNPAKPRLHWPDPETTVIERAYCEFMRELTARYFKTMLAAVKRVVPGKPVGLDAFKQTMLGWPLTARYTGDYQTHRGSMHAVSGAFGMAEMLDWPELDLVITPHDYLNRGMGFDYEPEGIGDAAVIRGKMMWIEEDTRTFSNVKPGENSWNAFRDMAEVRAGLWRNLGAALARGFNTYPMDIHGLSFFMDDRIQAELGSRRLVHEAATDWDRHEVPSIVMVVDDWSPRDEDFTQGYQYLAVLKQRMHGLARCGVPCRLHLLEDLARDNFPACHKVFLFPNLFRITPGRLALLREKVFRNGNVVIFGPATGITDGRKLSADAATELTGIPLQFVRKESPRMVTLDRFDHPITARLSRLDYGDSLVYGPLLIPEEHPEVKRLGGIQWPTANDSAGLVVRQFRDHTVVFSCAVPLPAELLREIARFSGTHVYGEADDLIFADSCSLTVHSVRPGERMIQLPKPATVREVMADRVLGENVREITIQVGGPQTRMFQLIPSSP